MSTTLPCMLPTIVCKRVRSIDSGDRIQLLADMPPGSDPGVGSRYATPRSEAARAFGEFALSDGSGRPSLRTAVQTCWDESFLYVAFYCEDEAILANQRRRDDPLYNEEVVEVFVAPGGRFSGAASHPSASSTASGGGPSFYYEFNLSPRNIVFDAAVTHDAGAFQGDVAWDCAGLCSEVFRTARRGAQGKLEREDLWQVGDFSFGSWVGVLAIPFAGLGQEAPHPGDEWRINFYRIKRIPKAEFTAWSPTFVTPPNFHVPERFGVVRFVG